MAPGQLDALKSAAENFNTALREVVAKADQERAQKRILGHNKHLINTESTHPIQVFLKFSKLWWNLIFF